MSLKCIFLAVMSTAFLTGCQPLTVQDISDEKVAAECKAALEDLYSNDEGIVDIEVTMFDTICIDNSKALSKYKVVCSYDLLTTGNPITRCSAIVTLSVDVESGKVTSSEVSTSVQI